MPTQNQQTIKLPKPSFDGPVSVEKAILKRRSIREYNNQPLSLNHVAQLLWVSQGIVTKEGFRTVPSAGALYPFDMYLVAGHIKDLDAGVYLYDPKNHQITLTASGDKRSALHAATYNHDCVRDGAASIVMTTVYEKTTQKYGDPGINYINMEAGHASQNLYLQAVSLNLGTVAVAAIKPDDFKKILELPKNVEPIYLMPFGHIA